MTFLFLFFFSNLKNGINLYGAKVTKVLQWTPFLRRKTMKVSPCFLLCWTGLNWFMRCLGRVPSTLNFCPKQPTLYFYNNEPSKNYILCFIIKLAKESTCNFISRPVKEQFYQAGKLPVCISCWETKVIVARYGLARKDPKEKPLGLLLLNWRS